MDFDIQIFESVLRQGLGELSLDLPEEVFPTCTQFAQAIVETNKSLNLTRIIESEEMAIKNFVDSLVLLRMEWPKNLRCLDLGTGAGFPGVPLAIARPCWSITLLDSLRKRLRFLDDATRDAGLSNVATLHARAEDAGQSKEHRQVYDVVVSRAVAHLPVLLELATPLVKVGGRFVAYKGSEAETELAESKRATKLLRVGIEQVFEIELPKQMGRRSILVFRKTAATPPTYPRKAGIPNKQPLV